MVWINSLHSTAQTMPITGQREEDRAGGSSRLGCSQQHIPRKPASQEIFDRYLWVRIQQDLALPYP